MVSIVIFGWVFIRSDYELSSCVLDPFSIAAI